MIPYPHLIAQYRHFVSVSLKTWKCCLLYGGYFKWIYLSKILNIRARFLFHYYFFYYVFPIHKIKNFSFSYFSNLTLHCLDAKKVNKPKKHAKHLILAQSFKMSSKKVLWYSTVQIFNIFMPWISKITIILDKMLKVFTRTSQLTFSRPSRGTKLWKRTFLDFAHA